MEMIWRQQQENSNYKNINAPTCTVSPTGWAQSKKVTCTYDSGYTNEYSIDV